MRFRLCCAFGFLSIVVFQAAYGGDAMFYSARTMNLANQSYQTWQNISAANALRFQQGLGVRFHNSGGTKAKAAANQQALQQYLDQLVPAMKPSAEVAHIPEQHPVPIDTTNPEKKWTRFYAEAKDTLRPHVKYEWSSNGHRNDTLITLSKEHVETLRANFDVIMWYRNELDEKGSTEHHVGTQYFKIFLDYIIAGILEGLPSAPEFNMNTGEVSVSQWELDERELREQLVMAHRYLLAKYQIYPKYEEFGPADRELLLSLMKAAFLMGVRMNSQWFEELPVNLNEESPKSKWKKPLLKALAVMDATSDDDEEIAGNLDNLSRYEEPCIIPIPPPAPKEKPRPKTATPQQAPKIEIIVRPQP